MKLNFNFRFLAKLLLVFFMFTSLAHAIDLEVALGQAKFGKQPVGIWYQPPMPAYLKLKVATLAVGINNKFDSDLWGLTWRYRAGLQTYGRVKSDSLDVSDSIYDPSTKTGCKDDKCPAELMNFQGSGNITRLYFTVNPEKAVGPVRVLGELGFVINRPIWQVRVPNWCDPCEQPRSIEVTHDPKLQPGIVIGWGLGLTDYPDWAFMVTRSTAEASGDLWPALYHGGVTSYEIRYKRSF